MQREAEVENVDQDQEIVIDNQDDTMTVQLTVSMDHPASQQRIEIVLTLGWFQIEDEGRKAIDLRDLIDESLGVKSLRIAPFDAQTRNGKGAVWPEYRLAREQANASAQDEGRPEPFPNYRANNLEIGDPEWRNAALLQLRDEIKKTEAQDLLGPLTELAPAAQIGGEPETWEKPRPPISEVGGANQLPSEESEAAPMPEVDDAHVAAKRRAREVSSRLGGLKGRLSDAAMLGDLEAIAARIFKINQVKMQELTPLLSRAKDAGWDDVVHTLDRIYETITAEVGRVFEELPPRRRGDVKGLIGSLQAGESQAPPVATIIPPEGLSQCALVMYALARYEGETGTEEQNPVFRAFDLDKKQSGLAICRPHRHTMIDVDMKGLDHRGKSWYVLRPEATAWFEKNAPHIPLLALDREQTHSLFITSQD